MSPKPPPHPLSLSLSEEHGLLKPNAFGLPHTEANQSPPIALSEAQMCALPAASHPLPPAERTAIVWHLHETAEEIDARWQ